MNDCQTYRRFSSLPYFKERESLVIFLFFVSHFRHLRATRKTYRDRYEEKYRVL